MKLKHILSTVFICFCFFIQAQPHYFFGEEGEQDLFTSIVKNPEGGFFTAGSLNGEVSVMSFDENMELHWDITLPSSFDDTQEFATKIIRHNNGLYLVGFGKEEWSFSNNYGFLMSLTLEGQLLWRENYNSIAALFDFCPTEGGFLLVGEFNPLGSGLDGVVLKVDSQGNQIWNKTIEVFHQTTVKRVFGISDGWSFIVGRTGTVGLGAQGVFVHLLDDQGNAIRKYVKDTYWYDDGFYPSPVPLAACMDEQERIWVANPYVYGNENISLNSFALDHELNTTQVIASPLYEFPTSLQVLLNGEMLMTGFANEEYGDEDYLSFARVISSEGLPLWSEYYNPTPGPDRLYGAIEEENERLVMLGGAGEYEESLDAWLLSTETDGNIKPWLIKGEVLIDMGNDCVASIDYEPAQSWFLRFYEDTISTLLLTDSDGSFAIPTDFSETTVELIVPEEQGQWEICNPSMMLFTDESNPIATARFLVRQIEAPCRDITVSICQPEVTRCEESEVWISLKNNTFTSIENQVIQVTLDPGFQVQNTSLPYNGSAETLTFLVNSLPPRQTVSFSINVVLDCDVQLGASHEIYAKLIEEACIDDWQGAAFFLDAFCENNEVKFLIENLGFELAEAKFDVFASELLIASDQSVMLAPGDPPHEIVLPADGRTWQIVLDQVENYPGVPQISKVIEACGIGGNGLHDTYFAGVYQADMSNASFDRVFPVNAIEQPNKIEFTCPGYGYYNLIDTLLPIDFTVRVENELDDVVSEIDIILYFTENFDFSTLEVLGGNIQPALEIVQGGFHFSSTELNIAPGEVATIKCRILPKAETPVSAGEESNFFIQGNAYLNQRPQILTYEFLNYYSYSPTQETSYYNYPPEIRQYGGKIFDLASVVAINNEEDVFLGGLSYNYSSRDRGKGRLIKTDKNGKAYWESIIVLAEDGYCNIRGVIPKADGGCFITGNSKLPGTESNFLGDFYPYYGSVNAEGELEWYQRFRPAGMQYGAGANGFLATPDGGGIIYGTTANNAGPGRDSYYLKLDGNGQEEWLVTPLIAEGSRVPVAGTILPDGSAVFCGKEYDWNNDHDVFIQQIIMDGALGFETAYTSSNSIILNDITTCPDGSGVMLAGFSGWYYEAEEYGVTPTFIKYSETGTFEWEHNPIVGTDYVATEIESIVPSSQGGFFVSGRIITDTITQWDMVVMEIDDSGDALWSANFGTNNWEYVYDMARFENGNIALYGINEGRFPLYSQQALFTVVDPQGYLAVDIDEVKPIEEGEVLLFPNPASSSCSLALSPVPQKNVPFYLYDVGGRRVMNGLADNQGLASFSVDHLPAGIYFLQIADENYRAKRLMIGK